MTSSKGRIGRGLVALGFVGALGFGAAQAFAGAPGAQPPARSCIPSSCAVKCTPCFGGCNPAGECECRCIE